MGVDRTFNSDALKAHNLLRALHGCEPIYYDDSLAQQAQAYAEKLSTKQRLLKSHQGNYGENVAVRTGLDADRLSGSEATLLWYGEILRYDFDSEEHSSCGQFCQVVWDETKWAGFGLAKSADGQSVYVVGHYFPPGDFANQQSSHVPRPLSGQNQVLRGDYIERRQHAPVHAEPKLDVKTMSTPVFSHSDVVAYRNAMLRAQNAFREGRGLPSLKRSWELEELAQKYAEGLKSGHDGIDREWKLNGADLGQNVMVSRCSLASPEKVVVRWMKESRKYKGSAYPKSLPYSKHFTQLMWAATKELGTGVVLDRSPHKSVIVCFYSPAGNEPHGYSQNIDSFRK